MTSSPITPPTTARVPAWADPSQTHRNNFDFIRLVLAVCVILSHSYPMVDPRLSEPLSGLLPGYTLGGFAVDGFFILSGYLITQSWIAKPLLGPFLVKRACRIYPAFVGMMLVLALVVMPFIHEGPRAMWRGLRIQEWFTTTLTLGPYIRPDALSSVPLKNTLNGSVWTVRFEGLCYLVLAAGMMLGLLRRRWVTLALFTGGLALWWYEWQHNWVGIALDGKPLLDLLTRLGWRPRWDGTIDLRLLPLGVFGGTRFILLFLGGAAFFQFRRAIPQRWYLAVLCLATWVLLSRYWHQPGVPTMGAAVFLPYVFLYLGFARVPGLSRFAKHGDFSYGTYLYGWPIQIILVSAWRTIDPLTLFAITSPLAVGMGLLSWHGIEKHFLRRRHKPRGDGLALQLSHGEAPAFPGSMAEHPEPANAPGTPIA